MNIDYFSLLERGKINDDMIQTVKDRLLLKYNESFEVIKIGQRYGMGTFDTARIICHPKENRKLLFTTVLNKDRVTLEDDYIIRSISYEIEELIEKEYKKKDIETMIKVHIFRNTIPNKKISLKEFQEKYDNESVLVKIYMKGKNHKKDSKEVMKEVRKECSLNLRGSIKELEEEKYNHLKEIIKDIPGNINHTVGKEDIIEEYRVEEV